MCFINNQNLLNENIIKASEITHAHPLAIEGARLIAFVTYAALHNWNTEAIEESKLQLIENSAEIISLSEQLYAISSNF